MSEDTIDFQVTIGGRVYKGKAQAERTPSPGPSNPRRPLLPEPYSEMVTVTDDSGFWKIKPTRFLETGDFAELCRIVKGLGGQYVSAGKSSHFRIPK